MTDVEKLNRILVRAQSHMASPAEYNYAADLLAEADTDAICLKCLLILRREASLSRLSLVSKFLGTQNPDLKEEVLRFLVRDIEKAEVCLSDIIDSLLDPDIDEFLCLAALQLAGEAYRQTKDAALLEGIIMHLESPREAFRSSASDSLVTALATGYEDMSPAERDRLKRESDTTQYLIEAHSRL